MRRMFWFGLGAGLGSYVTRKAREWRTRLTPRAVFQAVVVAVPGLVVLVRERASTLVKTALSNSPATRNDDAIS